MEPTKITTANGSTPKSELGPVPAAGGASGAKAVRVAGKFFAAGSDKLYVKGVTYGPFHPEADGCEYHDAARVQQDFEKMAAWGFNTVRLYTVPPRWLLDCAQQYGLRVMVGIPWEQHIAFLDDRKRVREIERKIREGVKACAGHPAVFAYAIGNEIPAPIVRWHGAKKIEKFLRRLYDLGKSLAPDSLFTYVNYPTTEYLRLPFLDFMCFNVYLEDETRLEAYLYRLQNQAGDKPLLMAELGLDSRRNSEEKQAATLEWQVRCAFRAGSAGLFVFSWTDEWYRGGYDIEDWDFGLVRRDGTPKAALRSVAEAYGRVPFGATDFDWPSFSVVVCTYNGSRTLRDCLEGLTLVQYPNFEVIIVNDGSTDTAGEIAREFEKSHGFRIISTKNRGLSNARNTGMLAAVGEFVAYTDDDARPDPHWLHYLASEFLRTNHGAIGGPNIPPAHDGYIAECVANAPGGPAHVLLSDRTAEHIPGCNMTFRKSALKEIGGFDPQYRTAGDDVDACWRIMDAGYTIGFAPAAMVWHHRRNSVKTFWKQQYGYGKAEALLEEKWPDKFNGPGHLTWGGRVYNKGLTLPLFFNRARIYQGVWGTAPFQSLYQPAPNLFASLVLMPEWYLIIGLFGFLSVLSLVWAPIKFSVVLFEFAVTALVLQAIVSATHALFTEAVHPLDKGLRRKLHALTAVLHLMQPLARLCGRIDYGLTFWRRLGPAGFAWPVSNSAALWSEIWREPSDWLKKLDKSLREAGFVVRHGCDYDPWDLEIRTGMFGTARLVMAIEDHGAGKQYARIKWHCKFSPFWLSIAGFLAALALAAAFDGSWAAFGILGAGAVAVFGRILRQCSCATAGLRRIIGRLECSNE
jgi:O-antigen biosynthesis protein